MKSLTIHAAILASLAAATPVLAQPPAPPPGGWNRDAFWRGAPDTPWERVQFLQQRIDRGMSDGSLNRREARHAEGELNSIREMARSMRARDGGSMNATDRAYIQERLDNLSEHIHWARHNW